MAGALIACTALLFVTIPDPVVTEQVDKKSVVREMKAGIREVRRHKGLGELMGISVMVTFILMPIATLFPLMTVNILGEILTRELSGNCLGERDVSRWIDFRALENKNPESNPNQYFLSGAGTLYVIFRFVTAARFYDICYFDGYRRDIGSFLQ